MVRRIITGGAVAGFTVLAAELAYAILRPSPQLADFDPSGVFGDPRDPSLRVAVIGDSTVTGPGVDMCDNTWARITALRMAELGYHVDLRSFAISGARARDAIEIQMPAALGWKADVIMVWIGANDLLRGRSLVDFQNDLDELVSGLAASGVMIVLSGIGDLGTIPRLMPPLRGLVSRRSEQFDRIHREIAADHGAYVFEQRVDSRKAWLQDRELWAADFFHMSAKGHARSADILWLTLEPLLRNLNATV